MRPSRFMLLAFVAMVVTGCSGAATAPSAATPTTAPAAATPAPTPEPVVSATPAPAAVATPSTFVAPTPVAGCLHPAAHGPLYQGLKDPSSLDDIDLTFIRAGIEKWEPVEEWQVEYKAWFLDGTADLREKVKDSLTLRSGERVIEACT